MCQEEGKAKVLQVDQGMSRHLRSNIHRVRTFQVNEKFQDFNVDMLVVPFLVVHPKLVKNMKHSPAKYFWDHQKEKMN